MKKQYSRIFLSFFSIVILGGFLISLNASCQDSKKRQQQSEEKDYVLQKTRTGNNGLTSELWIYKNDTSRYIIKKYRNKRLINISHYEKGLPNGYLMMANDNGTILLEGNMKNGKRDGIFRSYNEKGNLLNTMTYKNDSLLQKQ